MISLCIFITIKKKVSMDRSIEKLDKQELICIFCQVNYCNCSLKV